MKILASILPTVGLEMGAVSLGIFESSGIGINWDNYNTVYKNYSLANYLNMCTLSFFLFLIFGLYLDKVLPSQFGVRQPPHFFLLPSYWLSSKKRSTERCP
jgi:hypothetical protein